MVAEASGSRVACRASTLTQSVVLWCMFLTCGELLVQGSIDQHIYCTAHTHVTDRFDIHAPTSVGANCASSLAIADRACSLHTLPCLFFASTVAFIDTWSARTTRRAKGTIVNKGYREVPGAQARSCLSYICCKYTYPDKYKQWWVPRTKAGATSVN